MSASHAPAITAIAFQLSAALESYQILVDALRDPWSESEIYQRVSRKFDEVRMLKGAIPQLSVDMVEVLISHVELMKGLWLAASKPPGIDTGALHQLRRKHRLAVETMRTRCVRLFSRT